jgi:hypothetical protein
MTQAFNLSQFANNVNSSGKTSNAGLQNTTIAINPSTGISISNNNPALGGNTTITNTGVTSLTAGANIALSASTGAVTISTTGSGVTSLNGQTGGITNTNLDAIGSYVWGANCTFSSYVPSNTISGANLRVPNTITYISGGDVYSQNSIYADAFTRWVTQNNEVISFTVGNVGFNPPQGSSTLSGTWRAMGVVPTCAGGYNSDDNTTYYTFFITLWVRIS